MAVAVGLGCGGAVAAAGAGADPRLKNLCKLILSTRMRVVLQTAGQRNTQEPKHVYENSKPFP